MKYIKSKSNRLKIKKVAEFNYKLLHKIRCSKLKGTFNLFKIFPKIGLTNKSTVIK